jgi:hypothetical protein
MIFAAAALAAVLVATLHVTVVPLFAVGAATAELGVIAILVALMTSGPRAAMVLTPAVALAVSFSSDRAPGLLLLCYAAVLPIGYALDRYGTPPGSFGRLMTTALLSGVWVRTVLSVAAYLEGAAFDPAVLIGDVLLPGAAFDAAIFALVYVPLRLTGHASPRFSLATRGWSP